MFSLQNSTRWQEYQLTVLGDSSVLWYFLIMLIREFCCTTSQTNRGTAALHIKCYIQPSGHERKSRVLNPGMCLLTSGLQWNESQKSLWVLVSSEETWMSKSAGSHNMFPKHPPPENQITLGYITDCTCYLVYMKINQHFLFAFYSDNSCRGWVFWPIFEHKICHWLSWKHYIP